MVRADTEHSSGKVDFNSGASATQSGFTAFTGGAYNSGVGWGWTDSSESGINMATVDRGSGSGGAMDDLERDIHYAAAERWFKIAAPDGTYDYTWYYGDNGYAHGPWTLADNDGTEATGLSTNGSEWKHYDGTVTVSDGFLYIKCTPEIVDNMAYNGIEWSLQNLPVTTTNYQKSTTLVSTTATATSTVTLGTSIVTTTKSGGTSQVTTTCTTTSGTGGTTVSVIINQVLTSSISVLNSVTDPAGGTLTNYITTSETSTEISTKTCSSTTYETETTTTTYKTETTTTTYETETTTTTCYISQTTITYISSTTSIQTDFNNNPIFYVYTEPTTETENNVPYWTNTLTCVTWTQSINSVTTYTATQSWEILSFLSYGTLCFTNTNAATTFGIYTITYDGIGLKTTNTYTSAFLYATTVTSTYCTSICESTTITSIYSITSCDTTTSLSTCSTTTCDTSIESSTFSTTFCTTYTSIITEYTTTCETLLSIDTTSTTWCSTSTDTILTSETICITYSYTNTLCETTCETISTATTTCATLYQTSTSTTDVDTYTISGTSTYSDLTTTVTNYTSTSIVGVVGGACEWCLPLLILALVLFVAFLVLRRR